MIRGVHVVAIAVVALTAVAMRSTELYVTRYQTLPVLDWLDTRTPLLESANVPAATDLARGLPRALPLLVPRGDAFSRSVMLSPPGPVQRSIGGVRDAARIELDAPGLYQPDEAPIVTVLDVVVFGRAQRAAAWAELMSRAIDVRDPERDLPQLRTAGPDQRDMVWVPVPSAGGGLATVVGQRRTVGFMLQVRLQPPDGVGSDVGQRVELSARAETIARQAAADWSAWLEGQLAA